MFCLKYLTTLLVALPYATITNKGRIRSLCAMSSSVIQGLSCGALGLCELADSDCCHFRECPHSCTFVPPSRLLAFHFPVVSWPALWARLVAYFHSRQRLFTAPLQRKMTVRNAAESSTNHYHKVRDNSPRLALNCETNYSFLHTFPRHLDTSFTQQSDALYELSMPAYVNSKELSSNLYNGVNV